MTGTSETPAVLLVDQRLLFAPAIALVAVAIWVASGVPLVEALVYVAHFTCWVLLPGCLLSLALADVPDSALELAVVGAALGFAQVILGFVGAAMIGWREMSFLLPLASGVGCAVWVRRRRHWRIVFDPRLPEPLATCALAGLITLVMALTATQRFPAHPLPTGPDFGGASYYVDLPWHIGNAAGFKYFWPPQDLRVAGEPLQYYLGAPALDAHASLLTGIELSTLVLRLDPMLYLLLIALGLYWIGRLTLKSAGGGLAVLALGLLAGDMSSALGAPRDAFGNGFASTLYLSPTFALGLVLFIPLLVLCGRWVVAPAPRGGLEAGRDLAARRPAAMLLLLLAAALTKASIVPVLTAGAAGYAAWLFVRTRRVPWSSVALAIVCACAVLLTSPLVVPRGYAAVTSLGPLDSLSATTAWTTYAPQLLGGGAGPGLRTLYVVAGFAPLLLIGVAALLGVTRLRLNETKMWLLMVSAAGAAAVLLLSWPGSSQWYFWYNAYVALLVLGAAGLDRAVRTAHVAPQAIAIGLVVALGAVGFRTVLTPPAAGTPAAVSATNESGPEMTQALAQALYWIRANSEPTDVIATNNYDLLSTQTRPYRYFYYSALAERPILLEGFAYANASPRALTAQEIAYPERRALVDSIFETGDAEAVDDARDIYGVVYLLRDKRVATRQHELPEEMVRLVFQTADADVYEILAGAPDS